MLTHAIEAIGPDVLADTRQSGGGEDFSWYLEEVPGRDGTPGRVVGPRPAARPASADIRHGRARAARSGVRVLVNIVDADGRPVLAAVGRKRR